MSSCMIVLNVLDDSSFNGLKTPLLNFNVKYKDLVTDIVITVENTFHAVPSVVRSEITRRTNNGEVFRPKRRICERVWYRLRKSLLRIKPIHDFVVPPTVLREQNIIKLIVKLTIKEFWHFLLTNV